MAAPKAPLLGVTGQSSREKALDEGVFGSDVKPHLVHEAVRAEMNARRAGTQSAKSRGLVSGGRGKPWRQKGTGRARAGTIRAPQFTGGGVVFAPQPRGYSVKVNKKAYRSALRGALSSHAAEGTLAAKVHVLDEGSRRRRRQRRSSRPGARSAPCCSLPTTTNPGW